MTTLLRTAGLAREAARKARAYDAGGLHEALEEVGWTAGAPWDEALTVTAPEAGAGPVAVHDDLARELAFYNQALAAAQVACRKLEERGAKMAQIFRPDDYFAEMVKGDDHMRRVKERLQNETARIEAGEERRKAREAKKFAKQVQAEREKEKVQARKAQVKSVEQWRKQRKRNNYGGDGGDLPAGLENELEGRGGRGKESKQQAGLRFNATSGAQKSKKRQARDQKFGFGGVKKKLAKQNDAKSADDVSGFRQGKFAFRHGAKKKGGSGGGNRPGKARRAAARGRQ